MPEAIVKFKLTQRLCFRITIAIIAMVSLAFLVASVVIFFLNTDRVRHTQYSHLNQWIESFSHIANYAANNNDEELAQQITQVLAEHKMVSAASLTHTDMFNVSQGQFNETASPIRISLFNTEDPKKLEGVLKVYPNVSYISDMALNATYRLLLEAFIFSILMAVVLSIGIDTYFVRRIEHIKKGLNCVDKDEADASLFDQLCGDSRNELDGLVEGVDALASIVDKKRDKETTLKTQLGDLEDRFRILFEQASAGIAIVDNTNKLMFFNKAFERVMASRITLPQALPDLFLNKQECEVVLSEIRDGLSDNQVALDLPIIHEGEVRYIHCLFANISDERATKRKSHSQLIEVFAYDVSERMHRERQIRYESEHDVLTGLKNRRAGETGLRNLLYDALNAQQVFSLLMIDLDKFKPINDTYGHEVGDAVLKVMAGRIQYYFDHEHDMCVRWGGDEFIVGFVTHEYDAAELRVLAENLLTDLSRPIELENNVICHLGASIGVVTSPHNGKEFDTLISRVDAAMYCAKEAGRNRVSFWQPQTEH